MEAYNKTTYTLTFNVTLEDTDDNGDAPNPSTILDLLHEHAKDLGGDAESYGGRGTEDEQSCCVSEAKD